jgi:hypothetical protein
MEKSAAKGEGKSTLSFGTIHRLESTVGPVAASDIRSVCGVRASDSQEWHTDIPNA